VILLDTTFLCQRWVRPRSLFQETLERYDFVRHSDAIKIAFPQDDYDHAKVLDRWLSNWGIDVVFSPLARFASVLYPLTSTRAEIIESQTGYVDALDVAACTVHSQPFHARRVDVGYRARRLPAQFGRLGQLKAAIADTFIERLPASHGLVLDISTKPAQTVFGKDWFAFLGDCRFFLGTASGSSLLDPEGSIRDCIAQHAGIDSFDSFDAVEAACFPGLDGRYHMTALGPRHLECAMTRTCQILVPDEGLHPMEPHVHYIPIQADASDIERVLHEMCDERRVLERIESAHSLLVASPGFGYATFVGRIEKCIAERRPFARSASVSSAIAEASKSSEPDPRDALVTAALLRAEAEVERATAGRLRSELDKLTEELCTTISQSNELAKALGVAHEALELRSGRRGAMRELFGLNRAIELGRYVARSGSSTPREGWLKDTTLGTVAGLLIELKEWLAARHGKGRGKQ